METLISMTDFVLRQKRTSETYTYPNYEFLFRRCGKYADFLKQPLTLGMFVPCDLEGNVLESPYFEGVKHAHYGSPIRSNAYSNSYIQKYNEAKERVLFKGFELVKGTSKSDNLTTYLIHKKSNISIAFKKDWIDYFEFEYELEDMISEFSKNDVEIKLTESALKQIGV